MYTTIAIAMVFIVPLRVIFSISKKSTIIEKVVPREAGQKGRTNLTTLGLGA